MAALAIVTSSPPGAEGGHLVLARSLVKAARECGHDATLVVLPDYGFGRNAASYFASWSSTLRTIDGRAIDQVVTLRYPCYAVRHPAHLCWFGHAVREYYDLWARFAASISARARLKERVRRAFIHATDRWLLETNVDRVVAQSSTIQARLRDDFGIRAAVVPIPPPQRPYRCDEYGDFIFAVSRLTPLKRIDLLIRALAEPSARHVRAVVAGEGEAQSYLEGLAAELGVSERVSFLGRVSEDALLDLFARCRAVCFTPANEDYGLITVEAFSSRKGVITCDDSGGATDLVRHGESGLVCAPTPRDVAAALARLSDDADLAERFGNAAALQVSDMTWPAAVKQLVMV
jgi:glycosyltransferase involved in cell wall biosynthesis